MAWIRKLKNRFGLIFPKTKAPSQKAAPAPASFPAACPLRPHTESAHGDGDQTTYLANQGNQSATIARLNRILKMKTVILELGCGNAEIAWQIASKNPAIGVIATDIYRSPCLTGSVSGYAKASRAWTNGLLKAQVLAPKNLVILRAGACLLHFLPPESINTLLLINPEPAVGSAFLTMLAETPALQSVRPGPRQLVIKPFSKKMGIATCGGYEFNTEADWSRGIGFMLESPFVFRNSPSTQWHVDLGAFSDYSKNSTQAGVSVCDNISPPPKVVTTASLKGLPADSSVHSSGSI